MTQYRAKCQTCGKRDIPTPVRPGVALKPISHTSRGIRHWESALTVDLIPIVARCADCLGLKRKESAA